MTLPHKLIYIGLGGLLILNLGCGGSGGCSGSEADRDRLNGRFVFYPTDKHSDIIIMNADGTNRANPTSVAHRGFAGDRLSSAPALSPDGFQIAFISEYKKPYQPKTLYTNILVMDCDGSNLTAVTDFTSSEWFFVGGLMWSPDSRFIAFRASSPGPSNPFANLFGDVLSDIYVVRIGQAPPSSLAFLKQLHGEYRYDAALSPDWTQIAFTRYNAIFTISTDGGEGVRLTSGNDFQPEWSPDGIKIAFTRINAIGSSDIFVMNADGSDTVNLTATLIDGEVYPQWSPDGRHIAYHMCDGQVDNGLFLGVDVLGTWVMDADGSNKTKLPYVENSWYLSDWGN